MKNFLSKLWSSMGNLQSSDVSLDRRLTVGSPSGFTINWTLKLVSVLVLVLTIGIGNVWGGTATITEDFEKQSAGTTYNSTQTYTEANSNVGIAWFVEHGTVSTSSYLEGAQSMHMRAYYAKKSASGTWNGNLPYVNNTTDVKGLISITFNAAVSNTGLKMDVMYSTNSGSSWSYMYKTSASSGTNASAITFSNTSKASYTYYIPSAALSPTGNFRIKIAVNSSSTHANNPSGAGNYTFRVDNITFTYTAYTVTYNGNGNTSGSVPTDATKYTSGSTVTVKSNSGSLAKTGYTFSGWNTNASGTGTNYTAGSGTFSITSDITLFAKWVAAGTSVSLSKGSETNGTFSLSTSSVTTTSSAQTVTVTCSPNAGYYVSAISATNPATCPSAITYGGSNNSRTVIYPTGANGESTISVTFSPIWYLKGDFNSWDTSDPLTNITSNVATVTKSLSKTTGYEFKVYNAQEDAWYGNNGKIIDDVSGWKFSTDEGNCKVFATVADDYTFKFNISNRQMQIIYPDMTHPNDAYVYLTKWWDCYVHYWYTDGEGDHPLINWGYDTQLSRYEEICETNYWCVPILDGYPSLIMKDNAGDPSNTTGNQTTTSNGGKYITHNGVSWGWHDFDTYTVSYAGGGGTGSMSSHTDLCPGANQALSANTFAKTHYTFAGWHADVDVKVGGSTITAGNMISNSVTLQDIRSNVNLTAQWTPNIYTITKTLTNVSNTGLPASFTYTGATTTALNSTFTVDATNFFLPSSITVTMGGTPLTAGTDYTYNNSTGAFTFTAVITGNIVITATATAKLKSIAITTQPTTRAYLAGESFSSTGAVVTATMGDGSTKAVTASATWTPAGALSAGTSQTVTATYTEAGIEKTATTTIDVYSVTVNKVDMDGNAIADAGVTASCSGRTLSQSVSTTNYKFNSWVLATASGTSLSTNTLTGTPTGNVVVNAKFHKPITVTWKVGSGAASGGTSEVKYGTAIAALPSTPADNALASCGTNKFMGWSALGELKGTGNDAPADLFTTVGDATALTENTTYRAVFANGSGSGSEGYNKVTSTGNITNDGRYLIVYESGNVAFNGNLTTLDASSNVVTATVSTSAIAVNDDNRTTLANAEFSIDMTNKYIKSHSNKYINYDSYGNSLTASADATAVHSISIDGSGNLVIEGTGQNSSSPYDYVVLRFNSNTGSGNWRFRFYKGTQQAIQLYKYDPGTTYSDYQTGCCSAPGTALSITSANSVATGGTVSLTSTGGNGGTVTWSVVNGTGTASVAGTTLTAGSVGTVTVKAHQDATGSYCAQDAEQAFTVVSSTVNVTGVEVSPTSKAIVPGETFDITPTISPSNATDKSVSWTSSASDKASVSSGTVTGVAAGTATITCTTTDGSYTATTDVTVYGVTMQALDEDGNAIAVGGPGTPSRTGASISPAADAGNYVFKEWAISGASLGSSASTKANTITNPTGAVTVTAKYYKPRTVKWSVNGNDSYATGEPTTTVAYNGTISAVPTDPSGLACASTFVAWTDATHNNGQTAKDDDSYYESKLFTDAGDFPNITAETTTFYAVFAEEVASGSYSDGTAHEWLGSKGYSDWGGSATYSWLRNNNATIPTHYYTPAYGVKKVVLNVKQSNATGSNTVAVTIGGTTVGTTQGMGSGTTAFDMTFDHGTGTPLTGEVRIVATNTSANTTGQGTFYLNSITLYEGAPDVELTNYVTECDANIVAVTYNANGGTTSCTNTTTNKTEDYTVCSTPPTRDYYTFAGWLCSADDEVYAASATIDDAVIDADFTLTAQWTPVTYNITYELDGGTNNVGNPATYNVTTATITLQDPTKGHDRFGGWYDNGSFTGDPITSIPLGSHGNITLYAQWVTRHEIIFDADGATTTIYRADDEDLSASVAGQGSVPSDPSAPTACSTKVFVGWSESTIDGETDTEPGDLMKPAAGTVDEDKHYYAVWANESSESGTVTVFSDAFQSVSNGSDYQDNKAKPDKYTTNKVYGTGSAGEARMSSSSASGSISIDLSGEDLESTITVSFKLKYWSDSESGSVSLSCMDDGNTASFSNSPFAYPTTSGWKDFSSTVTNVDDKVESITFNSTSGKRVYIKDIVITQTGTIYSYSAYSTSCCATNVTLSQNSPSNGTIAFGKTKVPTCGGDKEVSLTITPDAGYQLATYSVATGSGKVATKTDPGVSLNNNSSAAQNLTLTFAEDANGAYDVTASFTLMTVTSWAWTMHDGGGAIPDPLNLYVGQNARLDVAYTPSTVDASKKTYTRTKVDAYINWSGAAQTTYSTISGKASTGESTTAVTFTHADGPTTTVNVKVLPLPLTHFVDLVHGKPFADVAATIEANALSATKTTPTSDDWTTPNANTCEENHLHLVGWIREDWPALVAYLNGTGDAPATTAIVGAGNDGSGNAYYIAAGASINVQTFDGVTFYAVWAEIK